MSNKEFNLNEFNKNFPSFEKKIQKENEIKEEKELEKIKKAFNKKYPKVNFDKLKLLYEDGTSTDDGCTHYQHTLTGEIYLWNYLDNKWKNDNDILSESDTSESDN